MKRIISIFIIIFFTLEKTVAFDLKPLFKGQLITNPLNFIPQNKCISDLGCFNTGPPFFDILYRPISPTPTTEVKTKYLLFTPTNVNEPETLLPTDESVKSSRFDSSLPTKITIHGFLADYDENDEWHKIKDALLKNGQYNVILLYWNEINGSPYPQAVANARVVGAQAAKLIKLLTDYRGVTGDTIHIIGHSLGGQMAGWIGETLHKSGVSVGRITGLDPAGPYFRGDDPIVHLDPTDADFIDVIHTDAGEYIVGVTAGLGISTPSGHLDFYPNGGSAQPGCSYGNDSISAALDLTQQFLVSTCHHSRAIELFLESISNQNCRYLAVQCSSYEEFSKGSCTKANSVVSEMGLNAKPIPNIPIGSTFYLKTASKMPFCIQDEISK
ncbi:pancreatic triacylglycerol lipase-like [Uloborus diversus]|uniref:pancreatic triacylglycerol lipase-like n=1 Tax=Uloborus diversus TaxID=327109 RepID=UPI0024098FC3|nr:pancreatic triacylglycerol lipase-like [Uloborus diversus]